MSCDCCPCWKARNRARIAVNDPETPQLIPVTSEGGWLGCLLSGLAAAQAGFLRDGETGGRTPPDPSPEEGKAEGIRSCPRCSSSCVLKCSLDKSRPASPATPRLRLHAGLRARGAAWTKELDTRRASIEPARTHKPARTCKQNLSCLATVVRAGKLETVPALPSTTRRHPS